MTLSSTFIHCPSFREIPHLVHGFTTRRGGVSRGSFESLNLGRRTPDDPEVVEANYERFSESLGFNIENIFGSRQVHKNSVLCVSKGDNVEEIHSTNADSLMANSPSLLLTVKVADCLPILLVDPHTKGIAVVHAGWRGTLARNLTQTIREMVSAFGAKPENLKMALGPGIGFSKFEVGSGVGALFQRELGISEGHLRWTDDKAFLDLSAINRELAVDSGVPKENIWESRLCTYSNESQFFSFRRDGKNSGRMLGYIGWRS